MKKSITFKGEELLDLYYALSMACNYYTDKIVELNDKCTRNLTGENCAEYRKWKNRYKEADKIKYKVFNLIYDEIIKQ